jgi:outer membrane autotransporter protein
MKPKDRRLLSAGVSAGLFLLSVPAFSDQLSKTDGGELSVSNDSFASVSDKNTVTDSAVFVSNDSTVHGENLVVSDADGSPYSNAVYARDGGKVNLSGNTLISGGAGIYAYGSGSQISMTGGTIDVSTQPAARVSGGGQVTLDGVGINSGGVSSSAAAAVEDSTLNILGGTTITSAGTGISAQSKGKIYVDGLTLESAGAAVYNLQGSVELKNFSLSTTNSYAYGLNANVGSTTSLENGTIATLGEGASGIWAVGSSSGGSATVTGDHLVIKTSGLNAHGVLAQASTSSARVDLSNTHVETDTAFGLYADKGGTITLSKGSVTTTGNSAVAVLTSLQGAAISLDGVDVKTSGKSAYGLRAHGGSSILASNSTIETGGDDAYAVAATYGGNITLVNVDAVTSGAGSRLFVLLGSAGNANAIGVTGGTFRAADAPAISVRGANNTLTLTGAVVSGDGTLLDAAEQDAGNPAFFTMQADASNLTGGARVDGVSQSNVELRNGTLWTLTRAADGSAESAVSDLTLDHSTIAFAEPVAGVYQTLTVGGGNPGGTAQYVADGATLRMNVWLNEGGALSNQQTDRLLINGDAIGSTWIQVNGVAGSPGGLTSPDGGKSAAEGISLVQVAGNASASSFRLQGEYATLDGLPYRYGLYAYGPGSENGVADDGQRLVAGTSAYWDYRLQSIYMDAGGKTREVAPQVPAYIAAPTALFDAGLQDISNLHSRLGEIRRDVLAGGKGTGELFMRTYGGKHDYASNRSRADYGYDADFDYSAMQVGGNLFALDGASGVARFGIAGTVGSLSYRPRHVAGGGSGDLHTWSAAAYGTYLHASGGYIDGVVSAGAFDGDVSTRLRGRTADLEGTSFAVSIEAGYPIGVGAGLVLEPQAQIVYQRLRFDRTSDVDGFVVDLRDQGQLTGRLGARLSRDFAVGQDGLVTLYAKADVLHGLDSGGQIFLGDEFQLGRYGTAFEGRLGVEVKASDRLSFHVDAAQRHEIGGHGVRGSSVNGGLRYRF